MFSDLVGSTALSARMDPEDLREVISGYQKCVAETVRRFGGFVAKYMGDGVLVYFGYPEAHEDDAAQAVRAGLELIGAVSALKHDAPLQTRVGIATGLVVVGDLIGSGEAQERGIVGETPNLAARLQGIAEPNMVVIAEGTRKLLGNLFELRDLGAKDLKGIAGPVRAWAALRAGSAEGRFEALHAAGLTALVGREEESELLLRRGREPSPAKARWCSFPARPGSAGNIAPGKVVFEVRNAGDRFAVFGILQFPDATFQRPKIRFMPSLCGRRLLMTQTFRDFFRSEVISATEGIAVRDVTLVFTDLNGSTALYERIGDLNAYIQVQRHFQHLLDVTVRHNGALTKTIGDAVMAAFETPADAVRAAFDMREAVDQLNRDRPQRDFILKIGVHRGASIAVTLNERLDYFGQTVNIAARVQNLADGDEICITEDVHDAAGVAEIVAPYSVAKSEAELKGVSKAMSVYHLARRAP